MTIILDGKKLLKVNQESRGYTDDCIYTFFDGKNTTYELKDYQIKELKKAGRLK